ncbi:MAG: coenzyme F420-0:L-glutamate ligase [Pseudomonadota bacterium]|nr:coenzyme F420-0:L-glutamate ligase [Pseudomonadota bacterium]MEC8700043.1 coenzyme F420-0:L-glutamate ligase [Pseudomonadota bacterium]MED6311086.1 coenzyme F420-0:L-glutamate ligase [Pseudomonadota bacterium]
MPDRLTLIALKGIPLVKPGDGLANLIGDALEQSDERLADGDILVVAQKIVSKTENRLVDVTTIEPSDQAKDLAVEVDKDPRVVEMILRESRAVIRKKPGVLIVENNLGLIMANAGIDHSNVESEVPERMLLLLPEDPDASAKRLQRAIRCKFGVDVGVIINDSVGRPWRIGTMGLAIGISGLPAVTDLRGDKDLFGRELRVSEEAVGDELAAAASLLQGQGAEGKPVVLVRGFRSDAPCQSATAALRAAEEDMFR